VPCWSYNSGSPRLHSTRIIWFRKVHRSFLTAEEPKSTSLPSYCVACNVRNAISEHHTAELKMKFSNHTISRWSRHLSFRVSMTSLLPKLNLTRKSFPYITVSFQRSNLDTERELLIDNLRKCNYHLQTTRFQLVSFTKSE
jgi:RNase adaptor protein for sRNA GlmZ degradation